MEVNNQTINAGVESQSSRFLSRKFLATVFTLLSATILVAMGFISDGVYSAVVIATNSAYLTANVMQKNNAKQP